MRFSLAITVFVCAICFTFIGCVTTDAQKPPEGNKIVELKIPEVGTVGEWANNDFGKKSVSVGTFSKEEIDGELSYFWKNTEKDVVSIYDLETMSWKGKWSQENKKWTERAKPHDGIFKLPLWVGKSYPANYSYSKVGGWSGYVQTRVTIKGWETIAVPAGTYETLKIVQKNQHFNYTTWFAPQLGVDVKWRVKNKKGLRSGELLKLDKP
jgi:hypothetical protein